MGVSERRAQRGRTLAVTLALIALGTNTMCAFLLVQLPASLHRISFYFTVYTVFSTIVSSIGLVGAVNGIPTLLIIFTNHLILDAIPRFFVPLLAFPLVHSLPASLCAAPSKLQQQQMQGSKLPQHPSWSTSDSASASSTATSFSRWLAASPVNAVRCRASIWWLFALLAVSWIALVMTQLVASLRVKQWAEDLAENADEEAIKEEMRLPGHITI